VNWNEIIAQEATSIGRPIKKVLHKEKIAVRDGDMRVVIRMLTYVTQPHKLPDLDKPYMHDIRTAIWINDKKHTSLIAASEWRDTP
jgi:hypothetical protein